MLRLIFILVVVATAGPAWGNRVTDMRVIGDSSRTRFVMDLEKSPDYTVHRLVNPYRLVVDLPEIDFETFEGPAEGRGLIEDYRYGLVAEGRARIVLDLAGPVELVSTFVLDPVEPEPARFVIDVTPTTSEAFENASRQDRARQEATPQPQRPRGAVASGKPLVVIDPGHGGIDSGAIGEDGLLEKDVTLKFGVELARQLKQAGELEPLLTRDDDSFVSLAERVDVASRHRAVLFVSIHADTVAEDYVRGATIYTLSDDASDGLAAALAERENRSDILAGLSLEDQPDDVADILFDLARRETRNISVRFAKTLVQEIKGKLPLNGNPWRRASFLVLKAPDVPSVLLELGYLSNPDDEAQFRSKDWPGATAASVARSIERFFAGERTAGQ